MCHMDRTEFLRDRANAPSGKREELSPTPLLQRHDAAASVLQKRH